VRGITSALEDTARDYELRSRGPATLDRYALDSLMNFVFYVVQHFFCGTFGLSFDDYV
jgi:hypothetical protein